MSLANQSAPDFRSFLQNELVARCKKNRHYSLRAFARTLDCESSALSKILKGQRKITQSSLSKMGQRLGLDPEELEYFREGLASPSLKSAQQAQFRQMSLDSFRVISDWYHFAILELMLVEDFEPNAKWVAKALGITVSEVNIAIGNLSRLGFIVITEDGKWLDRAGNNSNVVEYDVETAKRKLQKQILEKAIEALEEVDIKERDNSAVTFAIHTSRLPEAIEKITRFRRELAAFFEQDSKRDQVYHLAVALYPVTKIKRGKGNKR